MKNGLEKKLIKKVTKTLKLNVGSDCYSAATIKILAANKGLKLNIVECLIIQNHMIANF